jgi:hypothetical protein
MDYNALLWPASDSPMRVSKNDESKGQQLKPLRFASYFFELIDQYRLENDVEG